VSRSPDLASLAPTSVASSFKGLALFTPGGDCVYCIDQRKGDHWHLDLCAALQSALGLAEPPYFLLPCFTATVDRWLDPQSQAWVTLAEAYPRALQFQPLLNALFNTPGLTWEPNYSHREECSVWVIEAYQTTFPQLWESHDLVMQVESSGGSLPSLGTAIAAEPTGLDRDARPKPYVLKLFVSGANTLATEQMLRVLHNTLELALPSPYTLQLIDVLTHPDQAEAENISATPTLVQISPTPSRRLVGQVLSQNQIKAFLGQG
jgi:circadian clock protein KaiB